MLSAALLACSLLGYLLRGAVPSPAAASTSAACAPLVAADRRPPVAAACRRPIARLAHAFAVPASAGQLLRLAAADCRPPRVIITRMAHGRTLTIAQSMQRLWIFFSQMRRIGLLLPHTEYLPKKKKEHDGLNAYEHRVAQPPSSNGDAALRLRSWSHGQRRARGVGVPAAGARYGECQTLPYRALRHCL